MDRNHLGAFLLGSGLTAAVFLVLEPALREPVSPPAPVIVPEQELTSVPEQHDEGDMLRLREQVNFLTMKLAFLASLMAEEDQQLLQASIADGPEPDVAASVSQVSPELLIEETRAEDLALQKRAMSEGWVAGRELMERRMRLWQDAREQMSELDYLQGLYRAGLINQMYVVVPRVVAREAGIQAEDVLHSVDGTRIYNRWELNQLLEHQGQGSANTLVMERDGQRYTVVLTDPLANLELSGRAINPGA